MKHVLAMSVIVISLVGCTSQPTALPQANTAQELVNNLSATCAGFAQSREAKSHSRAIHLYDHCMNMAKEEIMNLPQ